jgi:hypothetical protein
MPFCCSFSRIVCMFIPNFLPKFASYCLWNIMLVQYCLIVYLSLSALYKHIYRSNNWTWAAVSAPYSQQDWLQNDAITTHADVSKAQSSAIDYTRNEAIWAVIALFLTNQIARIAHDFKMNITINNYLPMSR